MGNFLTSCRTTDSFHISSHKNYARPRHMNRHASKTFLSSSPTLSSYHNELVSLSRNISTPKERSHTSKSLQKAEWWSILTCSIVLLLEPQWWAVLNVKKFFIIQFDRDVPHCRNLSLQEQRKQRLSSWKQMENFLKGSLKYVKPYTYIQKKN